MRRNQGFLRDAFEAERRPVRAQRRLHGRSRCAPAVEELEGRTLLASLAVTSLPYIQATVPFTLVATVYRDDGTVNTDFDGTVNLSAVRAGITSPAGLPSTRRTRCR